MSQNETPKISLEPISLTRDKLQRRLEGIPITDKFPVEEKNLCKEVLIKLPEDVVALLDEDVLTKLAETKAAENLEFALTRFANNTYSLHTDDKKVVIAADSQWLPFQSMLMNATARGDCSYQVYEGAGWTLTIPIKAPVPSGAKPSPLPAPPSV